MHWLDGTPFVYETWMKDVQSVDCEICHSVRAGQSTRDMGCYFTQEYLCQLDCSMEDSKYIFKVS